MKLIKTISLEFREGKSDKVYEVDLCEVGPNRFVVNFRYGRRGTQLRDGSKTPVPVPRDRAEKIFDSLVQEKVKGGYREPGAAAPTPPAAPAEKAPAEAAHWRGLAIIARLEGDSSFRTEWKVSRVIWRAGELRLRAAEPLLWGFLRNTAKPKKGKEEPAPETLREPMRMDSPWTYAAPAEEPGPKPSFGSWAGWPSSGLSVNEYRFLGYSAAWALGRCGTPASLPRLRAYLEDPTTPAASRRIALESVRLLWTPEERAESARQVLDALPAGLAGAVRRGSTEEVVGQIRAVVNEAAENTLTALVDALPGLFGRRYARERQAVDRFVAQLNSDEALRNVLRDRLDHGDGAGPRALVDLYWIDDDRTRPALLEFLRAAPMAPNLFRFVRYIFKAAELRDDYEMFGLLAYRFETTRPAVDWHLLFPFALPAQEGRPHPLVLRSYTGKTRAYLRRRAWRVLDNLGKLASPDYVRLAEQVLTHFRDEDAGDRVPHFGSYYVLNRILYRHSPRFEPTRGGSFVYKQTYLKKSGRPKEEGPPAEREEAYPALWDRAPEVLLRLLERSRCEPVHEFAARALRANREFCRGLDLAAVRMLAGSRYLPTARLGMELVIERFDPAAPDPALVLVLADSALPEARRQAEAWVNEHWGTLRNSAALVVGLVASAQIETQHFARDLLRRTSIPDAEAQVIVARLVARLLAMGPMEEARANAVAATMQLVFRPVLRRIGEPVIRDLLANPLAGVQRLAGDLVLGHDTFAQQPPPDVLKALLSSPHAVVRAVGVKVLDQLDDALLKQNADVLVWLSRHWLADLRENIRATVRRLAAEDAEFGRRVAEALAAALLVPGAPEGVPSHTARVLREDLRPFLDRVPAETVMRLLQSRSMPAQEVGGLLLPTNVDADSLTVEALVRLASHDILSVRAAAWHACGAHPERLAADLRTAYRLADAKWEDSRRFAFTLFRDQLAGAEWPPEALIGLCDSVKPDVQRFGQELITRHFRDEHGEQFALQLTEHPDPSMQAFSGNFLDRFAADDPAHVRRLQFYCTAVLSRVNRGRVAKERVFAFLEKAARSGAEAAAAVAEVLARQSATAAVADRARALELMTFIHSAYPDIPQPIRVRPAEVRDAV